MFVGITGESGAGKSFITNRLANHSEIFCILDMDNIMMLNLYRKLQKEANSEKIKSNFPHLFFDASLYTFCKNPSFLNAFYKIFNHLIKKTIKENPNKIYVFDSLYLPILPKIFNKCTIKIYVTADNEVRRERILDRGYNTRIDVDIREKAATYIPFKDFEYDYVLDTTRISKEKCDIAFNEITKLIDSKGHSLQK